MKVLPYLDISFTTEGQDKVPLLGDLDRLLKILTKAPYNPQKRLFDLRSHLLTGIYHKLVLGCNVLRHLKRTDILFRKYVRTLLDLLYDVTIAAVKDGGFGIPSLRWLTP